MPTQFERPNQRPGLTRRRLLVAAGAMAATTIVAPLRSKVARSQPRFDTDSFTLGVASGDPVADGFVLWTRLASDPLSGGGMPPEAVPVRWEVVSDARFLDIVRRGETLAAPERGHSVHVDVTGLEPDRWYCYRFIAGGEVSPIGRTRTFPPAGSAADRLRFAFASCQHYGQGYFTAYEAMMDDDLDLIVHLGDYIYESDGGPKVRFHLPEPVSLEQYRNQHALYKSDRSLQAAHAWHPFAVTWDDHEVDNDYAAEHAEDQTPVEAFLERRAAAYQAYYEHMPLRRTAQPIGPDMTLYTTLTFGDLASFMMLDNRQYRSDQALRRLGLHTVLLTGDRAEAADRIAAEVGVDGCEAGLSPEGKRASLKRWRGRRGQVAMVGDGLNDGPVLAAADVGIAVGSATDLARETAEIVLPEGGLRLLPWAIGLSWAVRRTILTNLLWAFGYNFIGLGLAASGHLQPVLAAALMAGSSLLVVLNSLRLERFAEPSDDPRPVGTSASEPRALRRRTTPPASAPRPAA